jgi:hypothetical protein
MLRIVGRERRKRRRAGDHADAREWIRPGHHAERRQITSDGIHVRDDDAAAACGRR